MLSHDLAELYHVETRILNQQVKRNPGKFPERYMFQLTQNEYNHLRSHFVILKKLKYLPYAFTEHGVLMLASVLRSDWADKVNMFIVDTFVKIRELLLVHKDVIHQLDDVQNKLVEHDNQILLIFEYLKQLEATKQEGQEFEKRKRIGY